MRAHRVLGYLALALFSIGGARAQQYVISTIAGGAPPNTPASAIQASLGDPTRLASDAAGNVYFSSLHSVFKVDTSGTLTRFANRQPGEPGTIRRHFTEGSEAEIRSEPGALQFAPSNTRQITRNQPE